LPKVVVRVGYLKSRVRFEPPPGWIVEVYDSTGRKLLYKGG